MHVPRRDAPTPSVCAGDPGGGAGARLGGFRRSPATAGVLSQAAGLVNELPTRNTSHDHPWTFPVADREMDASTLIPQRQIQPRSAIRSSRSHHPIPELIM